MIDYFKDLEKKVSNQQNGITIVEYNILEYRRNYTFDLFEYGISDKIKYIYNSYKNFSLYWEDSVNGLRGFVDFVPYDKILEEHKELCGMIEDIEECLIDDQDAVMEDLKNWYPIFKFPNGDAFCYDKRNGKVVFFEHEVFDSGPDLHGLLIARTMDYLFEEWSKVLFIDIYDWYEGVNEQGLDLSKPIFKRIIQEVKGL